MPILPIPSSLTAPKGSKFTCLPRRIIQWSAGCPTLRGRAARPSKSSPPPAYESAFCASGAMHERRQRVALTLTHPQGSRDGAIQAEARRYHPWASVRAHIRVLYARSQTQAEATTRSYRQTARQDEKVQRHGIRQRRRKKCVNGKAGNCVHRCIEPASLARNRPPSGYCSQLLPSAPAPAHHFSSTFSDLWWRMARTRWAGGGRM